MNRVFNLDCLAECREVADHLLLFCSRVTVVVDWEMAGNTLRLGDGEEVFVSFRAWCRLQENKQRGLKPLPEGTVN